MSTFYSPQPLGTGMDHPWWSGKGYNGNADADSGRQRFEDAAQELQTAIARAGDQALLDAQTLQLLMQNSRATVQALRQNAGRRSINWFEATSQANFARIHGTGLVTRYAAPTSRVQAETTQRDGKTLDSLIAEKAAVLFSSNADFGVLTAAQRNRVCADIVVAASIRHEQVLSTMRRLPHAGRRLMVLAMAVCAYTATVVPTTVRGTVAPGVKPGRSRGPGTRDAVSLTLHEFVVGALEILDDGLVRFLRAAAAGGEPGTGPSAVDLIPKDGYAVAPPRERPPAGIVGGVTETLERFQTTEVGRVVQGLPPEGFIVGGLKGLAGLGSTERVAAKSAIRGFDQLLPAVTQGTANAASYAKLKIDLKTTQSANAIVESLKSSGKLPPHYMSKAQAAKQGWQPGKALNNSIPGAQIGGDVFNNSPPIKGLPQEASRIWREADIGISSSMSRSNQPGTRILYSDDGLLYITSDHYNSVTSIGRWKN